MNHRNHPGGICNYLSLSYPCCNWTIVLNKETYRSEREMYSVSEVTGGTGSFKVILITILFDGGASNN